MAYHSYIPAPPLGDFVERIFLYSYAPARARARIQPGGTIELVERLFPRSDTPARARERILPNGSIALVVNLRDDEIRVHEPFRPDGCRRLPGAVVAGA